VFIGKQIRTDSLAFGAHGANTFAPFAPNTQMNLYGSAFVYRLKLKQTGVETLHLDNIYPCKMCTIKFESRGQMGHPLLSEFKLSKRRINSGDRF